ncbi:MAG: DUF58 domain-containing protein [Chloroflexi bacterium]|nr:DUF58 domain-containing protein [Chloroflexota bacterium]
MSQRIIIPLLLLSLVLFISLSTGMELYYRFAYVLVLALAGGFVLAWLNLRWLSVKAKGRTRVAHVGGQYEEEVTVANRGWLPKGWLEVQELTDLPGLRSGDIIRLAGKLEPPWSTRTSQEQSWKLTTFCFKRGLFRVGPVRITSRDPLGFFRLSRSFLDPHRVTVYPAVQPLPQFPLQIADMPDDGRLQRRSLQVTPLASSVREYQSGDSISRVHWPSTARIGKLMVKDCDVGKSSRIWLIVDMQRSVQAGQGYETTDELSASVAASVAQHFLLRGLPVGLVSNGDGRCFVPPERGPEHLERILESLSLQAATGDKPLEDLLLEEERSFSRNDVLIVVTPSQRDEWPRILGSLRARYAAVIAIVVDADDFGGEPRASSVIERLIALSVPGYLVRNGQPLSEALSTPIGSSSSISKLAAAGARR